MNYTYAALFVLYNPSQEQLKNILNLIRYFDRVYIYDNTEQKNNNSMLFKEEKITYIGNLSNDGLSIAYNRVLSTAIEEGVPWLSIFDQDSEITETMISVMRSYAENNDNSKTASLVPIVQYDENTQIQNETTSIKWAINSGQMLNVIVIAQSGIRYDEKIFLDRVDRDFCKQVELAGLEIVRVKDAVLKQQLGEKYKNVFIHSPIRNYYIFKNRLYYNHKYYSKFSAIILNLTQSLKQILLILKVRKDIRNNLKMFLYAFKDYKKNNIGNKDGD